MPPAEDNLQRMIRLAEEFFGTRSDPAQISVTPEVSERLRLIHPHALTEERNEDGPIAWMLLFPTTQALKEEFIAGRITERELLEKTPLGGPYTAVYLCSALVLPEFRRKGLATKLVSEALQAILKDHPIDTLFYWAFSGAGEKLARTVSRRFGLPLSRRPD